MRRIARWLFSHLSSKSALGAALALLTSATLASAQDSHKDERFGFKVKVPRGWEQIPLRSDEKWIVGRYRSPKAETTVDPTTGYALRHNPELQIVALPHRKASPRKPETEPKPEGEGTTTGTGTEAKKPAPEKFYRDYQAFMKETYGRGHFVDKEESGTHAGLPVTKIEIKAERDVYEAEMRVFAWVFETELADVAVQVEIMADSQRELRSTIDGVLKSFTVIPRTQPLEEAGATEAGFLSAHELAKLTPAERKEKKIEAQRLEWERTTKDLPEGWSASVIDGVCVVSHVEPAFGKKVVEQINAMYAWLDVTFPEVGKFEYARPPIVRICASSEEESVFRGGGSGWYWDGGTQLVTHKDSQDWWDFEWDYIGSRTLQVWFQERDPEVWGGLPRWLAIGLNDVASGARMKSGKLVFDQGDNKKWWWREEAPDLDENAISIKTLLTLSRDDFDGFLKRDDWKIWWQTVALTRFFVEARSKKTRQILTDYMTNLHQVLSELEAQDDGGKEKAPPKNEAEEEALFKKKQEWLKARERAILDQSLARTFPGWTSADWKSLDREFRRSL
jgi:hypothetical protein